MAEKHFRLSFTYVLVPSAIRPVLRIVHVALIEDAEISAATGTVNACRLFQQ